MTRFYDPSTISLEFQENLAAGLEIKSERIINKSSIELIRKSGISRCTELEKAHIVANIDMTNLWKNEIKIPKGWGL